MENMTQQTSCPVIVKVNFWRLPDDLSLTSESRAVRPEDACISAPPPKVLYSDDSELSGLAPLTTPFSSPKNVW